MKAIILIAAVAAVVAGSAGAQPGRGRQLVIPPLAGFGAPQAQRSGQSMMLEMVPRSETLQQHSKIVTLTTFPVRPGVTTDQVLRGFVQRYVAGCPRAQVRPAALPGDHRWTRIDCTRHPRTGRPESTFVRVVDGAPAVAVASYTTMYFTMPAEAAVARDFIGRVGFR